jgi:cyclohexyl-isocyanide hydratase
MEECPALDVLLIPGGTGVNALMEDPATLAFIRRQAAGARLILSVCTGALLCGAAGLLRGHRATTHWASHHLLAAFGAEPVDARVVVDEPFVFAAGVTSGIDGALQAVALLRDTATAQGIQLYLEYAPHPPFSAGTPSTSPAEVLEATRAMLQSTIDERAAIVRRITQSHASP